MSTISDTKISKSLDNKFGFDHSWSKSQLVQNLTDRVFKSVNNRKTALLTKASLTSAIHYIKAHHTREQNYGKVVNVVARLHRRPIVKKSDIYNAVKMGVKQVPDGDKVNRDYFSAIIKHISHMIAVNVKNGNKVRLNSLGTFRRSTLGPRKARVIKDSPLTHTTITIPAQKAHHTIRFRGSTTLKNALK